MLKRLDLFVFIDAFGWELLKTHAFLDDELTTKQPLDTVFGYSSTCDPTILTGALPRDHGHFSFFVYDPPRSPFALCKLLSILPKTLTRRGRVRRLLSRFIGWWYGITGYFQIYNMPFRWLDLFDYTEKRDIYEPGGINSGAPTIFDHLRDEGIPFHKSNWRRSETENLQAARDAIDEDGPALIYLYLAAMDAQLHAHGTDSPIVAEKIRWYEARLRALLAHARTRYEDVNIYVFSDHGMTDTVDTCDLMARVDALDLRFGTDYVAVYDSTMARFWFLDPAARAPICEALEREPRGRILSDEQLAAWGCDFPDRRYGELFFLLDPGVLLVPSFMGHQPLAGMHGFAPDDPDSLAMFATNAELDEPPVGLHDLYRLMRAAVDERALVR